MWIPLFLPQVIFRISNIFSGLNVLDLSGVPLKQSDESIHFVGIPWQTSFASATIRGSGKDAKKAVQSLVKRL